MTNRDQAHIDGLLGTVERARREKNYGLMYSVINELESTGLLDDHRVQSRVLYERHMATYQMSSLQAGLTHTYLETSMQFAERSAKEAELAGDFIGALFAEMNISGLLLPALGRWEEGLALSEKVSNKAAKFANLTSDEKERMRALRVLANTYLHSIRITMEHGGDPARVASWLEEVKKNPVYIANKAEFGSLQEIEAYLAQT